MILPSTPKIKKNLSWNVTIHCLKSMIKNSQWISSALMQRWKSLLMVAPPSPLLWKNMEQLSLSLRRPYMMGLSSSTSSKILKTRRDRGTTHSRIKTLFPLIVPWTQYNQDKSLLTQSQVALSSLPSSRRWKVRLLKKRRKTLKELLQLSNHSNYTVRNIIKKKTWTLI